jgi:hypothetical protein
MIEAATAAGVDRTTLYRWRTEDEKFLCALEAWRREQVNNAYDRLSGMTVTATNVVGDAIAGGDARLAFRMLEKLGAAAPRAAVEGAVGLAAQATQYKRWTFTVNNPGNDHVKVQEYVATLVDGDQRVAGNITYRHHLHPYAADRGIIDNVLQQLSDLGASATAQAVTIVKIDEGVPHGHVAGPDEVMPGIMSGPAWATTLPTTETGGRSNVYKDRVGVAAHFDAVRIRVAQLEALDDAEERGELVDSQVVTDDPPSRPSSSG